MFFEIRVCEKWNKFMKHKNDTETSTTVLSSQEILKLQNTI